jgi:hypothetical protein
MGWCQKKHSVLMESSTTTSVLVVYILLCSFSLPLPILFHSYLVVLGSQ